MSTNRTLVFSVDISGLLGRAEEQIWDNLSVNWYISDHNTLKDPLGVCGKCLRMTRVYVDVCGHCGERDRYRTDLEFFRENFAAIAFMNPDVIIRHGVVWPHNLVVTVAENDKTVATINLDVYHNQYNRS